MIVRQFASKAAENIFPFVYKFNNYTPRLSTVNQLLDYLKESYLNYNLEKKINIKFEKLIIREINCFQNFKVTFLLVAK